MLCLLCLMDEILALGFTFFFKIQVDYSLFQEEI
jgi:hypothetical protein